MRLYEFLTEAPGDPAIDNATMTGSTPQQRRDARDSAQARGTPAGQPKTKGTVAVNTNPRQDGDFSASRRTGTNAGILKVGSDGVSYTWLGRQWVDNETGKMATKAVAAELGNPMLDELINSINKSNTAHLAADYILGRERALDTDARRSSGTGRSYADIDQQQASGGDANTIKNVKPNRAINQTQNDNDDYQADQRVSQQKFARTINKPTAKGGDQIPSDQGVDQGWKDTGGVRPNYAGSNVTDKGIEWGGNPAKTTNNARARKKR